MSSELRMKVKRERKRTPTVNKLPSLTRQSEAQAADINWIVAQLGRGADPRAFERPDAGEPVYADVSEMPDYKTAFDVVAQGEAAFAALDPKIRKRFENNPVLFLEFLADEKNRDEAIDLGLVNPAQISEDEKLKAIERQRRAAERAVDAEEEAARAALPVKKEEKK